MTQNRTMLATEQHAVILLVVTVILFVFFLIFIIWTYSKLSRGRCKFSGNLTGKVVIITGANTGIGFETAKDLAQRGAFIVAACRNLKKGEEAVRKIIESSGNKDIHLIKLDLASFASIRKFVDDVLKLVTRVDILINNAGIYNKKNEKTEDGYQIGMQINYLGSFLLILLLLPTLKKSAPSRIVNVNSYLHKYGVVNMDYFNKNANVSTGNAYYDSKLYMMLMSTELTRQLKGINVTVNSAHPGIVYTQMMDDIDLSIFRIVLKIFKLFCKTPWEGAQTSIYLSVSPEVENVSGRYFKDCREVRQSSKAMDLDIAKKLWIAAEKCVLNV